jgi:hypothetical protein
MDFNLNCFEGNTFVFSQHFAHFDMFCALQQHSLSGVEPNLAFGVVQPLPLRGCSMVVSTWAMNSRISRSKFNLIKKN